MKHLRSWMKWALLMGGTAWVARRYLQQNPIRALPADFDDDDFLRQATSLARRERQWASNVLRNSQDEALRTLARMALAQHQAADGMWVRLSTGTADDDLPASLAVTDDDFDREAVWTLQAVLDEAWPLFDQASQYASDDELREWSITTMTWLEEAEQTLAPILERMAPGPDSGPARASAAI